MTSSVVIVSVNSVYSCTHVDRTVLRLQLLLLWTTLVKTRELRRPLAVDLLSKPPYLPSFYLIFAHRLKYAPLTFTFTLVVCVVQLLAKWRVTRVGEAR